MVALRPSCPSGFFRTWAVLRNLTTPDCQRRSVTVFPLTPRRFSSNPLLRAWPTPLPWPFVRCRPLLGNAGYGCDYVTRYVFVLSSYGLSISRQDADSIKQTLSDCP